MTLNYSYSATTLVNILSRSRAGSHVLGGGARRYIRNHDGIGSRFFFNLQARARQVIAVANLGDSIRAIQGWLYTKKPREIPTSHSEDPN